MFCMFVINLLRLQRSNGCFNKTPELSMHGGGEDIFTGTALTIARWSVWFKHALGDFEGAISNHYMYT